MPTPSHRDARLGLAYGLAAYLAWGMSPAYFKLVAHVPPILVLAHRVLWSVLLLLPLLAWRGLWPELRAALGNRRTLGALLISTLLVAVNWYTFIYAIPAGRILQASLGYYINPLVTVLFGVAFLKERLRPWQLAALAVAGVAVAILTHAQRQFPAIALTLAVSFALYGLVRKLTPVGPMVGLFVETILLVAPAAYLVAATPLPARGDGSSGAVVAQYAVLACSGLMTALPLLWFNNAARRLRLATLGLLQYVSPTCNFLLAVTFYGEPFTPPQRLAFPLIWLALIVYSLDAWRATRAAERAPAGRPPPPEEPVLSDL